MVKLNLSLIISICLIMGGIVLFFIGQTKIALLLILLGIIGGIWKIYILKKGVKPSSNNWADISLLLIVLFVVGYQLINYFAFGKKLDLVEIIFGLVFLIIIYLYFKLFVPKAMEYKLKKK